MNGELNWRKSSASYGSGECVEVASCPCDADPGFRKSGHSMADGNCLEAAAVPGRVLVRDSKDRDGAVLAFVAGAWQAFTRGLKAGAR
jgi:Domain of unknown function (DUF397)